MYKLILIVLVFSMVCTALGHDEFPPDWRGQPGSLMAEWHTWQSYHLNMPTDNQNIPAGIANPLAHAPVNIDQMLDNDDGYNDNTIWGDSTKVLGIHGEWGPLFEMDNFDQQNPIKRIRIQITWLNEGRRSIPDEIRIYRSGYPIPIGLEAEIFSFPLPDENKILDLPWSHDGENYWNVSAFDIILEDNPTIETIQLGSSQWETGDPWWCVSQVVIDTQCTVPEPGTLALLVLGSMILRKRQ